MAVAQEVYLGNPNLKKANVAQNFTKKQVAEFLKCAEDPVYFIQKYVRIVSLDEGVIPFRMYDFQEKMVTSLVSLPLLLHIFFGMFYSFLM